jgi:hypothetical protein
MRETLAVAVGVSFSTDHIFAAALDSRLTKRIEDDPTQPLASGNARMEHDAYATNAVIRAAAFLEGQVSRVYWDAIDNPHGPVSALGVNVVLALAEAWPDVERQGVLGKASTAMSIISGAMLDLGRQPAQDVKLLMTLRDEYVHYKTRLVIVSSDDPDQPLSPQAMRTRLAGTHLARNPFSAPGEPVFPRACLSHDLAAWSVHTATAFYDLFYQSWHLTPDAAQKYQNLLDNMRPDLETG